MINYSRRNWILGATAVGLSPIIKSHAKDNNGYVIKLPTVVSYELNLPSLISYANGYYEREGIIIKDFVLGSGGVQRSGVIAKEYDIGLFGIVNVALARKAGSPWKAVMDVYDREIFSVIVRTDLRDEVRTVGDLRNRTVGFSSPGASAWYVGNAYLKHDGLDPQRDLKYIPLGGNPSVIMSALKTKKVDAFISWEPTTTMAINQGIAFPVLPIWEEAVHKKYLASENASSMLVITREDVIKEKPVLVTGFVNATKLGLEFIHNSSEQEIANVVLQNSVTSQQFKGLSETDILGMLTKLKPGYSKTGCLSRRGFEVEMRLAQSSGVIETPLTFTDYADASFAGAC